MLGYHHPRRHAPSGKHTRREACTPRKHTSPRKHATPLEAHTPREACTPWEVRTPLGSTYPPGKRIPCREADSSIRSMNGRYASYWNAFLLCIYLLRLVRSMTVNSNMSHVLCLFMGSIQIYLLIIVDFILVKTKDMKLYRTKTKGFRFRF